MAAGKRKSAKKTDGGGSPLPAARTLLGRRFARRDELGLTLREYALLRRLDTPQKIQGFLNAIPCNHEIGGETVLSVREVLRQRRAHCIEGAMVAAAALWVNGMPPLVLHLDCDLSDYPHVIAVFRHHGAWGAISKTNGAPLRYRDPIYRSLRELALSYFHEYFNKRGHKTLRSYSVPFDMRRIDPSEWVTAKKHCWETHDRLTELRHYPLISRRQERLLEKLDAFARRASKVVQYPRPKLP
ncbi:MAG TPA: hypothetical protein VFP44_21585 [Usitatibacter sp.]|nr:hypothetical protein [Usitatibacter sp.]